MSTTAPISRRCCTFWGLSTIWTRSVRRAVRPSCQIVTHWKTAIKTLATLAALHPLAKSTSVGLPCGVDPAISDLLPAHDEGPAMAQDILAMLRDPERLAERRNLVEQAQAAIRRGPDHAALLQALPRPTPSVRAERQSRWAQCYCSRR